MSREENTGYFTFFKEYDTLIIDPSRTTSSSGLWKATELEK